MYFLYCGYIKEKETQIEKYKFKHGICTYIKIEKQNKKRNKKTHVTRNTNTIINFFMSVMLQSDKLDIVLWQWAQWNGMDI